MAWLKAFGRVFGKYSEDNLAVMAGGCAFFSLMALVPAMTCILLLYGLLADPADIAHQMRFFWTIMPPAGAQFLNDILNRMIDTPRSALGISFFVSLIIAFWSSTRTVRAMIGALNTVYDEVEKRGFVRLNLEVLGITAFGILGFILAQIIVSVLPVLLSILGTESAVQTGIYILRWPILAGLAVFAIVALYRLAPSRRDAQLVWLLPGALFATSVWILASIAFSIYVENFTSFDAVYGSFGAAIILLLWLYWSFLIVLIGAELNAELEHALIGDTTTGEPRPIGEREAVMADTVASRPDI